MTERLSVVIMSLRPEDLGSVLVRLTLEPNAAKHITSVKISPSKNFLLLGSSSVGACVRGWVVRACVRVCVRAYVCACVPVCACVCASAFA